MKIRSFFSRLIVFCVLAFSANTVCAVEVKISNELSNKAVMHKMEQSLSALLTELNDAFNDKRNIKFKNFDLPVSVENSLSMMWENAPFRCIDEVVIQKCLKKGNSDYEIRNIPLLFDNSKKSGIPQDEEYQEAVVTFTPNGDIKTFYLAISTNLYMSVLRDYRDVTDQRYRELILDFTERFRTAYNEHNIDFLDKIFSQDALIITGKVIKRTSTDGLKLPEKVVYNKLKKNEYISKMRKIFDRDHKFSIHVSFDDIEISRHPNPAPEYKRIYGVTLHQSYKSGGYSDDGYLFLLWDFTNENEPKIHVRTWQPDAYRKDGVHKESIDEDEIFGIEDFDDFKINN